MFIKVNVIIQVEYFGCLLIITDRGDGNTWLLLIFTEKIIEWGTCFKLREQEFNI